MFKLIIGQIGNRFTPSLYLSELKVVVLAFVPLTQYHTRIKTFHRMHRSQKQQLEALKKNCTQSH